MHIILSFNEVGCVIQQLRVQLSVCALSVFGQNLSGKRAKITPCIFFLVFSCQVITPGGILEEAPGLCSLCALCWTSMGSSLRSCRSSLGSTTWWPPTSSRSRTIRASARRSRSPAWCPCSPRSSTSDRALQCSPWWKVRLWFWVEMWLWTGVTHF